MRIPCPPTPSSLTRCPCHAQRPRAPEPAAAAVQQLRVKWHGAIPSWIDAEGEFSAPDEEKLVRILGFQQPVDMGPFYMATDMDTDMDGIDI